MTEKNDYYKIFEKILSKKKSTIFVDHLYEYCNDYAENNNCLFLLDDIINTKANLFLELFNKNDFLKSEIKKKNIDVSQICYLKQEDMDPEKYKSFLEKKELEEYRRNNQATSDAFKCKKCGERKCQVTQKQTRSGDEPATTYVECMECGFLFKF